MNIKKRFYQILVSGLTISVFRLLRWGKLFGLPCGVLTLCFVSQAATAGIDDVQLYYRYVPYQPPAGASGTPSAKPSSGANQAEAKQAEQGGQAAPTQGNKPASPSEQVKENIENPPPNPNPASNLNSSQLSPLTCESGEKAPCVRNPEQESKQQAQAGSTGTGGQQAPTGDTSGSQPNKVQQNPETTGQSSGQGSASSQTSPSAQANPSSGQAKPSLKESTGMAAGKVPEFAQADANGDHYVTKDELKNYPDLLRVFDKVDAGKDGKLEQHEFQNLEMETRREGEVF